MRRWIALLAAVVFAVGGVLAAQAPRPAPATSTVLADSLVALDRAWGQAYVTGDSAFVDALLPSDWIGWYDDRQSDKKFTLNELRAGAPRLLEDIVDQATVRVFGNTAVIQARERIRVSDEKGGHWETRHITDVFILRHGRWYVIASHDSVIPNP